MPPFVSSISELSVDPCAISKFYNLKIGDGLEFAKLFSYTKVILPCDF